MLKQFLAATTLVALGLQSGVSMAQDNPMRGDQQAGQHRTITVSGNGEISAAPDEALITLGVLKRGEDQMATQREVEQVVRKFIQASEKLGVDKRHIKTTQLNIQPQYEWNKASSQRRLTGYQVQRQIEVELKDLSLLGLLLEEATSQGVNQANPPQLQSSRKDELQREALARAARNAQLNAQTVADTLGAKVGKARHINTTNVSFRPPPMPRMMAMESRSASPSGADTFETGEISFSADVTVEFDLLVEP